MLFDVEVDVSAVASSHDEQIDQLLGREVASLQTHGGKAHCLAASCLSCVYVAHVIPSLTCRVPLLGFDGRASELTRFGRTLAALAATRWSDLVVHGRTRLVRPKIILQVELRSTARAMRSCPFESMLPRTEAP